MEVSGKSLSAKAVHAIEVLSSVQATKELLARILNVDVGSVEGIFDEIRAAGLLLVSSKSEDDRIYYSLDGERIE